MSAAPFESRAVPDRVPRPWRARRAPPFAGPGVRHNGQVPSGKMLKWAELEAFLGCVRPQLEVVPARIADECTLDGKTRAPDRARAHADSVRRTPRGGRHPRGRLRIANELPTTRGGAPSPLGGNRSLQHSSEGA